MTNEPTPDLTPPYAIYDLRTFFGQVGSFHVTRALTAPPAERPTVDTPVELLDEENSQVSAGPARIAGFVDGVQATGIVTHRAHRPVYLMYCAAGAVDAAGRPLAVRESLHVVTSAMDADWLEEVNTGIPSVALPTHDPSDLERDALTAMGLTRDGHERQVVHDLTDDSETNGVLVLDGSLLARPRRRELVGVVKSTRTRYLPDEVFLWNLPQGWRSPRFRIPSGLNAGPETPDRYSCYVRLHDADRSAWNHGLIRIEAFDPDLLEPLAAAALDQRQYPSSGDPRWDRHLAGVAAVERFLKDRRPSFLTGS